MVRVIEVFLERNEVQAGMLILRKNKVGYESCRCGLERAEEQVELLHCLDNQNVLLLVIGCVSER